MVIVAVLKERHAGRENSWGWEVKQNLLLYGVLNVCV